MSWSLMATGSKAAVKRQLGEQKIWGDADPAEQAVFDATREQLLAMTDRVPDPTSPTMMLIIRANAAGHGTTLSSVGFTWESHAGV